MISSTTKSWMRSTAISGNMHMRMKARNFRFHTSCCNYYIWSAMAIQLAGQLPVEALQLSPIWRCNILQKYFATFAKKCLQKTCQKFSILFPVDQLEADSVLYILKVSNLLQRKILLYFILLVHLHNFLTNIFHCSSILIICKISVL